MEEYIELVENEEEVEKMKKDAETHADEDTKKKEGVEVKNIAEQTIYAAEKALKDAGMLVADYHYQIPELVKQALK